MQRILRYACIVVGLTLLTPIATIFPSISITPAVYGQSLVPEEVWQAVLQMEHTVGTSIHGSSVTVIEPAKRMDSDEYVWLAVGCAHHFKEYRGQPLRLRSARKPHLQFYNVTVVAVDHEADLSIIRFVPSEAMPFVPLASQPELVSTAKGYTVGYPAGQQSGLTIDLTTSVLEGYSRTPVRNGHSGGGLFVPSTAPLGWSLGGVLQGKYTRQPQTSLFSPLDSLYKLLTNACQGLRCDPRQYYDDYYRMPPTQYAPPVAAAPTPSPVPPAQYFPPAATQPSTQPPTQLPIQQPIPTTEVDYDKLADALLKHDKFIGALVSQGGDKLFENMQISRVVTNTLAPGANATANLRQADDGAWELVLGIPTGAQGPAGPVGSAGEIDYGRLLLMLASDPRFQPRDGEPAELDYQKLLDALANDSRFTPKRGAQGPQGPQGPPGQVSVIVDATHVQGTKDRFSFENLQSGSTVIAEVKSTRQD